MTFFKYHLYKIKHMKLLSTMFIISMRIAWRSFQIHFPLFVWIGLPSVPFVHKQAKLGIHCNESDRWSLLPTNPVPCIFHRKTSRIKIICKGELFRLHQQKTAMVVMDGTDSPWPPSLSVYHAHAISLLAQSMGFAEGRWNKKRNE